jgi:hypothetical protein
LGGGSAISAGGNHSLALKANGVPVAWGSNAAAQSVIAAEAIQIHRIAAGGSHNLALRQAAVFPGFGHQSPIRGWPGESVNHSIPFEVIANAAAPVFSAMGLPDGFNIGPQSASVAGSVSTGETRAVRVSAATEGSVTFSDVIWFDTVRGVGPSDISLSHASVMENSPAGTLIGTLSAVDPNSGDSHELSLDYGLSGRDSFRFEVQGNQLLVLAPLSVNFEAGVRVLNIRLTATDSGGNTLTKDLAIALLDDRTEDADGDGYDEATEEDILGTSDTKADDFRTADPDRDGTPSLLEHAFNLNPKVANPPVMLVPGAGSTAGLPAVTLVADAFGNQRLRLEYICRIGTGMQYTPQFGSGTNADDWLPASNAVQVTPINSEWERHVVEDSQTTTGAARRFARVAVSW